MRAHRVLPLAPALFASLCGLLPAQAPSSPAPQSAASSGHTTCPIVRTPQTEGEALLVQERYKDAESLYRQQIGANAQDTEAHYGLVRALIGEDRTTDALAAADAMLAGDPKSAIAEVAEAEAYFRAANLEASIRHAQAAVRLNPCEGRAYLASSAIWEINGYYAKTAGILSMVHTLRPMDERVQREWINYLPRKQRQAELARYLGATPHLNADDERGFNNELEHLKAHKVGECRITSKADTVATGLQPIYGDNSRPEAYGLDVQFDGKRRRMQIDTGASGIVLSQSAARGLGLEPEYHIKTGGIGDDGLQQSYLTHVKSIRIGDVEVSDCMVEVLGKSKLDVDGLIGMDVFSRWLVTLDYQNAKLRLAPLPPRPGVPKAATLQSDAGGTGEDDEDGTPRDRYIDPSMKGFQNVLRIGHQILLPSQVIPHGINTGKPHYLIMDTGASATNLEPEMAKEGGKLHGSDVRFYGISGDVKKVYTSSRLPLQVANLLLPPEEYFVFDTMLSHSNHFETSGLLGLPTLQRLTITIDYRDNLLKLSYDSNNDRLLFK